LVRHNVACDTWETPEDHRDDLKRGGFRLVRVDIDDMPHLIEVSQRFRLDFNDAYQYVVAEKYDLSIVSFDGDFD